MVVVLTYLLLRTRLKMFSQPPTCIPLLLLTCCANMLMTITFCFQLPACHLYYKRMTSKTVTNQNSHMIMVIGEHVNKYLSVNKLGIIKSRTETTGPVARRIQATGSNNEDAARTQSATSAEQVDKERATPFIHTVGRV